RAPPPASIRSWRFGPNRKAAEMALTNQHPHLLSGTLYLLILRALVAGPLHGYGIADRLKILSQEVLQVGESSLYPALQRLLLHGWVNAEWVSSEEHRGVTLL